MLEYNRAVQRRLTFLTRFLMIVAVCICAVFLLAQVVSARNTYLIDDNGRVLVHTTYTTDPAKVLEEAGVELSDADKYIQTESSDGWSITILRCQTVTVYWNDKRLEVQTYGETVESLLTRMNVYLTGTETVSVPLHSATSDGMVITVSRLSETLQTYTESIPFQTIYCYDSSLQSGQYLVLTAGQEGQLLCTATVQYADGEEISRIPMSQTVVRQPVTQVIAVGTGKPVTVSVETDVSEIPGTVRSGS